MKHAEQIGLFDRVREPARSDELADDCAAVLGVLKGSREKLSRQRIGLLAGVDPERCHEALHYLWTHAAIGRDGIGLWWG